MPHYAWARTGTLTFINQLQRSFRIVYLEMKLGGHGRQLAEGVMSGIIDVDNQQQGDEAQCRSS